MSAKKKRCKKVVQKAMRARASLVRLRLCQQEAKKFYNLHLAKCLAHGGFVLDGDCPPSKISMDLHTNASLKNVKLVDSDPCAVPHPADLAR